MFNFLPKNIFEPTELFYSWKYPILDCRAMAIGARSQAARTYLEKYLEELADCDMDTLIKHGLRALRDTLPNEVR